MIIRLLLKQTQTLEKIWLHLRQHISSNIFSINLYLKLKIILVPINWPLILIKLIPLLNITLKKVTDDDQDRTNNNTIIENCIIYADARVILVESSFTYLDYLIHWFPLWVSTVSKFDMSNNYEVCDWDQIISVQK